MKQSAGSNFDAAPSLGFRPSFTSLRATHKGKVTQQQQNLRSMVTKKVVKCRGKAKPSNLKPEGIVYKDLLHCVDQYH